MSDRHVSMMVGTETVPVDWQENNRFEFQADLEPGLYIVGIQTDLSDFNWEELYYPMTRYENSGQRTGPWDFDLYDGNKPLVPTWKIHIDGRYVGLFYLQRCTEEDIQSKILRGEFGFRTTTSGPVHVVAEPYRDFTLDPIAMYLEPSAFDRYEPQPWAEKGKQANWAWHIANTVGWDSLRERMVGSEWEAFLRRSSAVYTSRVKTVRVGGRMVTTVAADALPSLLLSYRLLGDEEMLQHALGTIDYWLEQPAWGNPDPMGYGHNGDMGCALTIKYLSLALVWLEDVLGDRKAPLQERLTMQMGRFVEQQQLMHQYWGGALLQDHGYRSSPSLGFAAINMLGYCEDAPEWLAFYVPRFYRTLDKLPTDGFIPFSSYHKIQLYVNDMADFRTAYLHASGRDLFAESEAFRAVPHYILSCLDVPSMYTQVCSTRGDAKDFRCGLHFFASLARDFGCEKSRYLAHLLMEYYRSYDYEIHPNSPNWKVYETMPISFIEWEDGLTSSKRPEMPALNHFPDGGAVQYRHEASRFSVAVGCLPTSSGSFHSTGTDLSGTDMGIYNPSTGNFSVAIGRQSIIQSAESGYRTGSELGNILLIDGHGQIGDCKYPMGVPLRTWHGGRIQNCQSSENGGKSRLNLAPAYPDELGLLTYTRDFTFEGNSVHVRDTVITRDVHSFAYCFNTWRCHPLEQLETNTWLFCSESGNLRFEVVGSGWQTEVKPTEVVWAYGNENNSQLFKHLEVATSNPVKAFVVDFVIDLA